MSDNPTSSSHSPNDSSDTARVAGRGGLAVLGAKAFFILINFATQTLLPRLIGKDGFGALARVLVPVNIVNNVVITSSIQGVSRAVAQASDQSAPEAFRRTLKIHWVIALPVALLFFFFAPIYGHFQLAQHIVRPLQIVSIVVLGYGLYAPLIGSLNGRRLFTRQAALDVIYATLRTVGLLGIGWLFVRSGQGYLGACVGFALASILIFPVALRIAGTGRNGPAGPSLRDYLLFLLPVALGQMALQVLMQSDLSVLGRFASQLALGQGFTQIDAKKAADETVGVYRACQLFAFLPYQLLISFSFVLFPMLAKAKADQDRDAIARYVGSGMRLSLVFASLAVGTVAALAPILLRLAFSADFSSRGGDALRVLALGQGCFAVFYIETTVLTSLGKERLSSQLTALAAVLVIALCFAFGLQASSSDDLIRSIALATSLALVTACVIGGVIVRSIGGGFASVRTIARTLVATTACVFAGSRMHWMGLKMVIPQAIGAALCGLAVLIITGELRRSDLDMLSRVVRPKRPTQS